MRQIAFSQIPRFGSEVYLIEALHGVLPGEDDEASALVGDALLRDGVQVICCGKNMHVGKREDGIVLTLFSHEQNFEVVVDQLLVATGRAPNIESLQLDVAGIASHDKGVTVNDRLQTSNRRVFAAGDVCSPYQFTHAADFMARIAIQNALFMGRAKVSALTIPWCTYTKPEVAHVGLYPHEAEARGIAIDTYTQRLDGVDRAVLDGKPEGFVRVHTRRGKDEILGATAVAGNAGDMIGHLSMAMTHGLGLKQLGATIHPYPTQAEAIRKLGDQYNRGRLTSTVSILLKKWLSWTR